MAGAVFDAKEVYVGRDFGGTEYEISADAIENYIAATGDDHPWYRGASPLGYPLAPALIVHSAVFRTFDWYLPNIFGNLHARQEWEGFSPIRVGATLHSRSHPSSCACDVRSCIGHSGQGVLAARPTGGCGRSSNCLTLRAP